MKLIFTALSGLATAYYTYITFNTYAGVYQNAQEQVSGWANALSVSSAVLSIILIIAVVLAFIKFGWLARTITTLALTGTNTALSWWVLNAQTGASGADWASSFTHLPTQIIGTVALLTLSYLIPLPAALRKVIR